MNAGLSSSARAGSSAQQDHSLPCCPCLLAAAHAQPQWKQVFTTCFAMPCIASSLRGMTFGAHSSQTGSRTLKANNVCTTNCFQMPCITPWYSSLDADWQAGICMLTSHALAYHDQHAVWSYHQHPLSLHELRTINFMAVKGTHLVLAACAHSVMSSHDHACLHSVDTGDWLQRCLHDCWGQEGLAC